MATKVSDIGKRWRFKLRRVVSEVYIVHVGYPGCVMCLVDMASTPSVARSRSRHARARDPGCLRAHCELPGFRVSVVTAMSMGQRAWPGPISDEMTMRSDS